MVTMIYISRDVLLLVPSCPTFESSPSYVFWPECLESRTFLVSAFSAAQTKSCGSKVMSQDSASLITIGVCPSPCRVLQPAQPFQFPRKPARQLFDEPLGGARTQRVTPSIRILMCHMAKPFIQLLGVREVRRRSCPILFAD